jgi:hypothetical protein
MEAVMLLRYLHGRVIILYPSPRHVLFLKLEQNVRMDFFMYSKKSRFPVSNIETVKNYFTCLIREENNAVCYN